MVKVILYRDRNRTGESAATASAEGADLASVYKNCRLRELHISTAESQRKPRRSWGTFDRDLTVTGANNEKHQVQESGSKRPISEQW